MPREFKRVLPAWRKGWQVPKEMWERWAVDGVTTQWSPADIAQAIELAEGYYDFTAPERRLIKTAMGLNARGRRDLRWRNAAEAEAQQEARGKTAEVRRMRLVAEREAERQTAS